MIFLTGGISIKNNLKEGKFITDAKSEKELQNVEGCDATGVY
jgi:hypothetical protein